jgi:hypothetical protein
MDAGPFVSFDEAKRQVLAKLYEETYLKDDADYFFLPQINALVGGKFSEPFLRKVLVSLVNAEFLDENVFEDEADTGYSINEAGIQRAEEIAAQGTSGPPQRLPASLRPLNRRKPRRREPKSPSTSR